MIEVRRNWTKEEQEEIRYFWEYGFWNQLLMFVIWQAIGTIVIILW